MLNLKRKQMGDGRSKDGEEIAEKGTSKRRSKVWDHFTFNDQGRAICKWCKKDFLADSKAGTTHLKRHMDSTCKSRPSRITTEHAIAIEKNNLTVQMPAQLALQHRNGLKMELGGALELFVAERLQLIEQKQHQEAQIKELMEALNRAKAETREEKEARVAAEHKLSVLTEERNALCNEKAQIKEALDRANAQIRGEKEARVAAEQKVSALTEERNALYNEKLGWEDKAKRWEKEKSDWMAETKALITCARKEEVRAHVFSEGILHCSAPPHKSGMVPFYITCSKHIACSELPEFELREPSPLWSDMEVSETSGANSINERHLYIWLEELLSVNPSSHFVQNPNVSELCNRITELMVVYDDRLDPLQLTDPVEKLMKERLHLWLIQRVSEDGKAPSVLGRGGQGVIHLAAALDYDWAMVPIVVAGVNVNFRDVHGWTALHWAAFCGRKKTVVFLKVLGADPGAVTEPTREFPNGRTPADLASANGHKSIAGYLAESSLTSYHSSPP